MKSFLIRSKPASYLDGKILLPGDKSIAHRCVILSALARGKTIIKNFPLNKDCLYTVKAFKKLGIKIGLSKRNKDTNLGMKSNGYSTVTVFGQGLWGLKKPQGHIFLGNSGTSLRLILGVLAGQHFQVRLIAGKSLSQRPMLRVIQPLRLMGAKISAKIQRKKTKIKEEYPPITIKAGNPKAITYQMPVASAQVKSAILLAALYAREKSTVIEPIKTRDHTERLLKLFQADIKLKENKIIIQGNRELVSPGEICIPGDISSAAFFIVLAALLPRSRLIIKDINLNPSRRGLIRVLQRMRADIQFSILSFSCSEFEPRGNITVRTSQLKGTSVKKEEIPSLIDELPILMVAASKAEGRTVLEGIDELRLKETDRIKSLCENLTKMGCSIHVLKDKDSENMVIEGADDLKGCRLKSFGDHRSAMSMVVAGLVAKGNTCIDDISCIDKSFPEFMDILKMLIH